eukprot:10120-Heterococcus_DN1.PRE.1
MLHALKHDWSGLSSRYWPVVLVDELLASINSSTAVKLHNRPADAPFAAAATGTSAQQQQQQQQQLVTVNSPYACASQQEVDAYRTFVTGMRQAVNSSNNVLAPLQHLMHGDMFMAEHMFETLLPKAWQRFTADKQSEFGASLVKLLAQPHHKQGLHLPTHLQLCKQTHYVNVVQSLVRTAGQLRPLPILPLDMLAQIGVHFNAWHDMLPLMEYQLMHSSGAAQQQWLHAVTYMYDQLGESDVSSAIQRQFALTEQTKLCVALQTYGFIPEAKQAYALLMQAEVNAVAAATAAAAAAITQSASVPQQTAPAAAVIPAAAPDAKISVVEAEAWETRWIDCARKMSEWPELLNASAALQYPNLLMESAFKTQDWET